MTIDEKYINLLNRIAAVRKKEKIVALTTGVLIFFAVCLAAFLIALILESIFSFEPGGRVIIDLLLIFSVSISAVFFILKPIYSLLFQQNYPHDDEIASQLGKKIPGLEDRLVDALQVYRAKNEKNLGLSPELAELSLNEIFDETKSINFSDTVTWQPARRWLKYSAINAAMCAVLLIIFSTPFSRSMTRLLHPFKHFKLAEKISFEISPGNARIIKNESVTISAKIKSDANIDEVFLNLEDNYGKFKQKYPLTANDEGAFSYTIPHIQDTTIYFFSVKDHKSQTFRLEVVELPLLRRLFVTVTPPQYSGMKQVKLAENVGDFSCLRGSVVFFNLVANKTLQEATFVLNNKKQIPLQVSGERAKGYFKVKESGNYYFSLKDLQGMENANPIEYQISIVEDIFPTISIKMPGQDVDLSEDLILPLEIEAEDDFGFTKLQLNYRILRSDAPYQDTTLNSISLAYEVFQNTKLVANFLWQLSSLDLFPGDVVNYFAEVFDNDDISGPKSTKSLVYSARFPTLEEIYAAVNSEQEQTYDNVEGLYETSKELKKEIETLVQDLKKNPEMKWEQQQQVDDILKNQKKLEQSLEEVQQQLDQMLERMEKNDLVSLETLKKYSQLQELLNEILTDELKEALKKLQQAAEQMDPELIKEALEQMNFSQEDFLKNIEKTLEMLKRIQIEQKIDELVRKLENLVNDQQKVSDKLQGELCQEEAENLKQAQQEIRDKSEQALAETQKLADLMKEFNDMPDEALEALLEQAKREGLLDHMNQVSKNLSQGNQQQAQNHSQMAMNALANMLNNMNNAKQQMIARQKAEIMRELRRLTHNFVSLSKQQESLYQKTERLSPNSPQLNDLADKQQSLLNALERNANKMAALSQKTFFVSPEMARTVGQAMQFMNRALSQFEQRSMSQTSRSQQRAMFSLNEAAQQMISAMNDLANAQSATGLQEMLQRLAQMAGKQQGINQQTMQLGIGQNPLSLSMQAQMARLAAEQMALRKTMEQLQQEFGERSEILGRLDGIAKQMEEVAKDLQAKNVTRKTIRRQQKILQRLLDAQKSARRQDFSRKRRAETGKFYPAVDPGKMPQNLGEQLQNIQKDLLKALKEGYSKDYQKLIKKYFEALIKKNATDEKTIQDHN